jgi:hypothetical protein
MRLLSATAAILLALPGTGCAARLRSPGPAVDVVPAINPRTSAGWHDNLLNGALLAAMVYGAGRDHERLELAGYENLRALMPGLSVERRLELFAARGLHAAYIAPRLWIMPWVRYPELYVLGDAHDQSLCLVFVGSNDAQDWYQNAKTSVYEDTPKAGRPFIPSGHAGFRRGVRNLIAAGFFTKDLPGLAQEWGIKPGPDGRIPVFVAGHSLGAAMAQLSLPCIEGWHHTGADDHGFFGLEKTGGLFAVRGAYLIAPPYAVASDEFISPKLEHEQWQRNVRCYEWMVATYGPITWNVLHDADVVCSIYDVRNVHEVSMKHLGHRVRIDGRGQARVDDGAWGNQRPHDYWGYYRQLRSLKE